MAHYKTIIFDLSEVLLDFVVPLGDDLARRLGSTHERIYQAFENDHMEPYYRGLISEDDFCIPSWVISSGGSHYLR